MVIYDINYIQDYIMRTTITISLIELLIFFKIRWYINNNIYISLEHVCTYIQRISKNTMQINL